ncbi:helix-turn-helix domain-containing protein [Pyruvatibacter mobilis]|uniref:helix-turn-helix domain-containing protein n=1 Tax=Pyruvatibacter mobilis TaxID=1712261 RepID=UPI003BACCC10
MARIPSFAIAKRNEEIVRTYENDLSVDFRFLEARYGVSRSHIKRILREAGVHIRPAGATSPPTNVRVLSQGHRYIAHKLNVHLALNAVSVSEMAERLAISEKRLNGLLQGTYDPSLSEVQRLNRELDLDLQNAFD